MWGAFSPIPAGYPPLPLRSFDVSTLEDLKVKREFERLEACKIWSQKLDIPGFIQASSLVSITFIEWIGFDGWFYQRYGLPTMIKEALKSECKRVVDDINKKREEEVSKLKLDQQSYNRHSTMASSVNPVDKVFTSR